MKVSRVPRPAKKPKLGQHFLNDTAAAVRIVEALGDLLQSTVLEIGPGRGALTNLLARRARRVIAVEKDRVLAAQLRMHFSLAPKVHSAVVRLVPSPRLEKLHVDEKGFIEFLKLSFAQKRKTLWNNLKGRYPSGNLDRALARAKVKPSVRAEAISLEASANIFRELNGATSSTDE